ncbi:MAG: DUF5050 domain-containing protein [Solirubrobacterales bacterium]
MRRMQTWSRARVGYLSIAAVVAAVAVMGLAASSASAYIYVAGPVTNWLYGPNPNPSTIERLTLDGSAVQPNFIAPTRADWGIEASGNRIYWLDYPGGHDCNVKSASLAGTDVQTLAAIDVSRCSSAAMAIADGYLYWGSADGDGKIGRISLQPPYDVQPGFIHLPQGGETTSLVTDGTWLYWMDEMRHTVGRARVDGTDIDPALFKPAPPSGNVGLFGVSQQHLYWSNNRGDGSIGRARVDGSDLTPDYLTGFHSYAGALTSQALYFTGGECGAGCVNVNGTVRRVALEPGSTPVVVAQGLGEGVGYSIGVDSLGGTFPKVRIKRHGNGSATALLSTSRRAKVSVRGKRIVRARARHRRAKVVRVAIRPRRATKRALQRHGTVRVRARLRYRPGKGLPRFQNRAVTLRLGRRS